MEQFEQLIDALVIEDESKCLELLPDPEVLELITYENNCVVRLAAAIQLKSFFDALLNVQDVLDNIAADDNYVLRMVAAHGWLDSMERLLLIPQVVENIATNNFYILRITAKNGNLEMLNLLLKNHVVLDAVAGTNNVALRIASEFGRLDIVRRLLEMPSVIAHKTGIIGAMKMAHKNEHKFVVYELNKALGKQGFNLIQKKSKNKLQRTLNEVKDDKLALALVYKGNRGVSAHMLYKFPEVVWLKISQFNLPEIYKTNKSILPLYMFTTRPEDALLLDDAVEAVDKIQKNKNKNI